MNKTTLSMEIVGSSAADDITVTVALDETTVFSGALSEIPTRVSHEFDDTDAEHVLSISMSGKHMDHTQVNEQGEITKDVLMHVKDFEFDGINVDQLVWQLSQYHHDFNGSQDPIVDRFYGTMGCNGAVKLQFQSPIYLWLLENM